MTKGSVVPATSTPRRPGIRTNPIPNSAHSSRLISSFVLRLSSLASTHARPFRNLDKEIDAIDDQMLKLISERANIAIEVAHVSARLAAVPPRA